MSLGLTLCNLLIDSYFWPDAVYLSRLFRATISVAVEIYSSNQQIMKSLNEMMKKFYALKKETFHMVHLESKNRLLLLQYNILSETWAKRNLTKATCWMFLKWGLKTSGCCFFSALILFFKYICHILNSHPILVKCDVLWFYRRGILGFNKRAWLEFMYICNWSHWQSH